MILELFIALAMGIMIGTATGLFPGVHINLVAFFLLELSPALIIFFPPIALVIFIVSISITHTFVDFVPTIFLGAPDEETALSILPGHEMLLKGEGYEAVVLSIIGGLIGIILLLPLLPIFIYLLPIIYIYIQRIIPIILILLIIIMILFEKNKKFLALIIIVLSGALGYASLNLNLKDPLLPMLTGLFGSSSLITSITKKQRIPGQKITKIKAILQKLEKFSIIKPVTSSLIAGPICASLPALGSSQASIIGSYVIGDLDRKEFLVLVGIVNTLVMSLSFVILYSINKSRTGSAVAVSKLISKLSSSDLAVIIIGIIVSAVLAAIISIIIAKCFSRIINRVSYKKLSVFILILLTIITIIFSGIIGLIIFITSTSLGIMCIILGIKRTSLMGCLIIPTIIIYLF